MDDTSQLHPPISTENRSNEERIPAGSRRRRQLLRDDDNQNDIPRVRSKTVEVSTSEIPSQVSGPKMRINATEQGNDGVGANALDQNQNTVLPPALETNHLKRLRVSMNEFRAKYPTDQLNAWQFATSSAIGKFKGCFFYLLDDEEARGMAFRAAYDAVPDIKNSHELCTYVGSMLCDVFPGFRSSVEAALNGIGVKPLFVRLPSVACDHNLKRVSFPKMDCPTILVNFGCCVLVVLMKMERRTNYETFMRNCIGELQGRAGCVPYASNLNLPFEFYMADEIRTMLGASSNLRANIVKFLISNIDQGDTGLGGVCRYLCDVLSWSGMREFTLLNELLVRPRSPVLLDPRVSREVDNLTEACEAIASCPYPQFFMHLANNLELIKVEPLRFPTLIAVARELEWGHNGCSTVANSEATLAPNPTTVLALVELHRINNRRRSQM